MCTNIEKYVRRLETKIDLINYVNVNYIKYSILNVIDKTINKDTEYKKQEDKEVRTEEDTFYKRCHCKIKVKSMKMI